MLHSTYNKNDVIFLLKDLTDSMPSTSLDDKEKLIAQGINYSEMITDEKPVSDTINQVFENILQSEKSNIARYVGTIADAIMEKSENPILVSLARAGTPIGILVKRYIKFKYGKDVPHYSISIIREKGIDENALNYILEKHKHDTSVSPDIRIQIIDGWTGKKGILRALEQSITEFNKKFDTQISSNLIVLADPAKSCKLVGTQEDVCIPNACLNSTVSGLVSRTIENKNYIGPNDFHGAKVYTYLSSHDYSNFFLDEIEKEFKKENPKYESVQDETYVKTVLDYITTTYHTVPDKVKLSIGEASRALIRRKPKLILVNDKNNPQLQFILKMAEEKYVEVKEDNLFDYACVAILQ